MFDDFVEIISKLLVGKRGERDHEGWKGKEKVFHEKSLRSESKIKTLKSQLDVRFED